jgi:hypothetical protein
VSARDREKLEKLCRYAARPAVAESRLVEQADGRIGCALKKRWRDGTTAVVMTKEVLMERGEGIDDAGGGGFGDPRSRPRERVLADPYGRLFNALPGLAFERHPYRRPVIGSEADLNAATLDDVRRFHTTYYRPDNAVLIVVGDFDPAQLDGWVDRYFGPLARPTVPIPRVTEKEPPRTQNTQASVTGPSVPPESVPST